MLRFCLALLLMAPAAGPSFIYEDPAADQAIRQIKAYLASAWGSKARFRLTQHGVSWGTVMDGRQAPGYAEEVYKAAPDDSFL